MGILDWLKGSQTDRSSAASDVEAVRRISRELGELDPEQARYVACFAYILGRVAHADLEISDDETAAMERVVMETTGLPEQQAVLVVQMAKTHNELFGGTENFLVTREFAAIADLDQKRALLDCLYAVSAADDSISAQEDHEIRRIASELNLPHSEFIAARSKHEESLDLLKD